MVSVVVALGMIPLSVVNDHVREQVDGLPVPHGRDLDDLGLSHRQPKRRLRFALLSWPIAHARTTSVLAPEKRRHGNIQKSHPPLVADERCVQAREPSQPWHARLGPSSQPIGSR
jgi:hypothetical protein